MDETLTSPALDHSDAGNQQISADSGHAAVVPSLPNQTLPGNSTAPVDQSVSGHQLPVDPAHPAPEAALSTDWQALLAFDGPLPTDPSSEQTSLLSQVAPDAEDLKVDHLPSDPTIHTSSSGLNAQLSDILQARSPSPDPSSFWRFSQPVSLTVNRISVVHTYD